MLPPSRTLKDHQHHWAIYADCSGHPNLFVIIVVHFIYRIRVASTASLLTFGCSMYAWRPVVLPCDTPGHNGL